MARHVPTPRCPVRPGEPCGLCHPGATGPADCGVVYLALSDPDLREAYRLAREAARRAAG
ncbi:DUF6767 domain-containing protein [Arsenicicoccus sp. oral taxon 190]|uniref:DUF6767 domain-containing protein n=1 Tax=Arsenicicoccus sp. oral taxon 190 TaxID=1658671 RepID=UPI00067A0DCF|nr:DUF6767 domain-containing protein [Arsenicicoccus sp. oral taxon 190]AKT51753.1 hypothetical protein ADJ73_11520 [Arsenicicoccus sp. oral taxon 190]